MQIYSLILGELGNNCYILVDEQTKKAAVIDPSVCNERLIRKIEETVGTLEYILLTHGHFDHIGGVPKLKEKYPNAKIAIHKLDENCFNDDKKSLMNISQYYNPNEKKEPVKADIILKDNDEIKLGNLTIKVMHTPGHTPGGVCFICNDVIFSGDTLFCKTVGRTDFFDGSFDDIIESVKRLGNLDGDYRVLPGHSVETTLEDERKHNRYMRKMVWS